MRQKKEKENCEKRQSRRPAFALTLCIHLLCLPLGRPTQYTYTAALPGSLSAPTDSSDTFCAPLSRPLAPHKCFSDELDTSGGILFSLPQLKKETTAGDNRRGPPLITRPALQSALVVVIPWELLHHVHHATQCSCLSSPPPACCFTVSHRHLFLPLHSPSTPPLLSRSLALPPCERHLSDFPSNQPLSFVSLPSASHCFCICKRVNAVEIPKGPHAHPSTSDMNPFRENCFSNFLFLFFSF